MRVLALRAAHAAFLREGRVEVDLALVPALEGPDSARGRRGGRPLYDQRRSSDGHARHRAVLASFDRCLLRGIARGVYAGAPRGQPGAGDGRRRGGGEAESRRESLQLVLERSREVQDDGRHSLLSVPLVSCSPSTCSRVASSRDRRGHQVPGARLARASLGPRLWPTCTRDEVTAPVRSTAAPRALRRRRGAGGPQQGLVTGCSSQPTAQCRDRARS
mmetsp:Transcript_22575/g.70772  ORF Transcript_22575/g.70772 Transcript_22575/m.70772 type:complete len:218 (-) Transcript_22575:19-672(-)